MISTYSYLEPVLEVLHAESIVVPLIAVHLPLLWCPPIPAWNLFWRSSTLCLLLFLLSTCIYYDVHLFLPGTCSGGPQRCVYCCSSYSCLPASIMMSTYSYLEPVLEVLHAVSIVVPLTAVHLPLIWCPHIPPGTCSGGPPRIVNCCSS